MKKILFILSCACMYTHVSYSQAPLAKQWDHTYGGVDIETLTTLRQTYDGGFILGGYSKSDSSGEVTQVARGGRDFWMVKTDALGIKEWDKRFGGSDEDRMYSLVQTADSGFVLAGYTRSDSGGDVSQVTRGGLDFWIVKTDAQGNKQWDKRFGGNGGEIANAIRQTADGGYIIGGYTLSDSSGEVSHHTHGSTDFWLLKINSAGIKQWDKLIGGNYVDEIYSLEITADGGYILGGRTNSDSSGDVSYGSRGGNDFWVVKTDSLGNKIWDKRFGGNGNDIFKDLKRTFDGGYILGGFILSDSSGEVSQPTRDTSLISLDKGDYWIVKIDSLGNLEWNKRYGGNWVEDAMGYVIQTSDSGYMIGGASYSNLSGDKTENNLGYENSWLIKTDPQGNKIWDKTITANGEDEYAYPIQTTDGCYAMANWSYSDNVGYKTEMSRGTYDFWLIKFCESLTPDSVRADFTVSNPSTCSSGCFSFYNNSFAASSYRWLFPGGTPSTSTLSLPYGICYTTPGVYDVTLIATNPFGSDTLVKTGIIVVHPIPVFTISQHADTLFAPQNFAHYHWYLNSNQLIGDTSEYLIITQNGTYSVSIIDTNGCPSSASILIQVTAGFEASDSSICEGSCINFSNLSSNATSYEWLFPGASPSSDTASNPHNICYAAFGIYNVTLIASDGINNDTIVSPGLIRVNPIPSSFAITRNVDTLFAPIGYTHYQWYLGTTLLTNDTNYFYIATQNGTYEVVITDSNGCENNSNFVFVDVRSIFATAQGMTVFPNPARDVVHISLQAVSGSCTLSIINSLGQEIYLSVLSEKEAAHFTLTSKFTSGVYTAVLQDNKGVHLQRFVVE